jgi:Mor family transcriptional regulator
MPGNAERNREMLAAYEAGRSIKLLSQDYGLSVTSIGSILTGERHSREVSQSLITAPYGGCRCYHSRD